jgi:hypothetical protein
MRCVRPHPHVSWTTLNPKTIGVRSAVASVLLLAGFASAQTSTAPAPAPAPASPAPAKATEPAKAQGGGGGSNTGTKATGEATTDAKAGQVVFKSSGIPQKDTLLRMMQVASVDFNETRLEDVMRWVVATSGGADIDVMWMDDRNAAGLDKDTLVTLKIQNKSLLSIVETVLERSVDASLGPSTWQMSESGAMQIGPRERLNKFKRVEVYPIRDMIMPVPDFTNGYELDLQQALQQASQRGGGGGGQSPFTEAEQQRQERRTEGERADEIIDIITTTVESEQWQNNGGDGGSIRFFQGSLLVNAPDYVHRQLNGYPYWPKQGTKIGQAGGKRYVTMTMDGGTTQLKGFENVPAGGG